MGKSVGETLQMEGQVNGTGSDLSEPCRAKNLGTVGISLLIFPLMHLVGLMTFILLHIACEVSYYGIWLCPLNELFRSSDLISLMWLFLYCLVFRDRVSLCNPG